MGNFEWRPKWGTIPQPIPYKGIALANCAIWPLVICQEGFTFESFFFFCLAGAGGFEPPKNNGVKVRRLNHLATPLFKRDSLIEGVNSHP